MTKYRSKFIVLWLVRVLRVSGHVLVCMYLYGFLLCLGTIFEDEVDDLLLG